MPVVNETAFKIGAQKDPVKTYLSDMYTVITNLIGAPAISFPIGFVERMPYGAQLMGARFQDHKLLTAVHQFQSKTDFHYKTAVIKECS